MLITGPEKEIAIRVVSMPHQPGSLWSNPVVTLLLGVVIGFVLEFIKKRVHELIDDWRMKQALSQELGLYLAQIEGKESEFTIEKRPKQSYSLFSSYRSLYDKNPGKFSDINSDLGPIRRFITQLDERSDSSVVIDSAELKFLFASPLGKSIYRNYRSRRLPDLTQKPQMFLGPPSNFFKKRKRIKNARKEMAEELGTVLQQLEFYNPVPRLRVYSHYVGPAEETWEGLTEEVRDAFSTFALEAKNHEYKTSDVLREYLRPYAFKLLKSPVGDKVKETYLKRRQQALERRFDTSPYETPYYLPSDIETS